ncbi:unnamed protein product [Arctogadus glacialis]
MNYECGAAAGGALSVLTVTAASRRTPSTRRHPPSVTGDGPLPPRPPLSPGGRHCLRAGATVSGRAPLSPGGRHCLRAAATVSGRAPLSPGGRHCLRAGATVSGRAPLSPGGRHCLRAGAFGGSTPTKELQRSDEQRMFLLPGSPALLNSTYPAAFTHLNPSSSGQLLLSLRQDRAK